MIEKMAIRYDPILTKMAVNIFGDIVEKAYITTWDISSDRNDVISRLNNNSFFESKDPVIDYSGEVIWIRFTNGKIVEFQNSEWAYISPIDSTNFYET